MQSNHHWFFVAILACLTLVLMGMFIFESLQYDFEESEVFSEINLRKLPDFTAIDPTEEITNDDKTAEVALDLEVEETTTSKSQPDSNLDTLIETIQVKKATETKETTDPFSIKSIQTRMIFLQNRPELGLIYHEGANLISNKQQYAIIVSNLITKNSPGLAYFFNIPITCQSWRQIGYGCFIVIPYYRKDPEVINALEIVKKHVVKWGQEFPGSIVVLEMEVPEEQKGRTIQVAQVVRLFIAQILKYSMNLEDFASIQNTIYLITTDVDLLPLSTKVYKDLSHD